MSAFGDIFNKKNGHNTPAEICVLLQWTKDEELAERAATELAYLQACAAEWDFFAKMEGTDATKVAFMRQTVRKLAKMKRTK